MTRQPEIKRYVGFYLIEGFWAVKKPDYTKFGSQYWLTPEFSKLMEEPVVTMTRDDQEIIVFRDGMIAYSDNELNTATNTTETFKRIEKYSEILNALFCIFVSTFTQETNIKFHTNFEVTHHDIVPLTYEDGQQRGMGIPQKSVTNAQLMKRFLSFIPSGYTDSLDLYLDMPPRPIIVKEAIEKACNVFFGATPNRAAIKLLARSNKAAAEFASTSFSDSILVSWLQVETYLYAKLKAYTKAEGSHRFNRDRRDLLQKDSTVSEIIELLEVSGNLNHELYTQLTRVRKVRNKIVHDNYSATVEQASEALDTLEKVIHEVTGTTLRLNTGITMSLF